MYKLCKTEESAARQKMIEDALLQAMLHQRFEDISVSSLCERAGIPRITFYRYFPEKEDVLLALIDHTLIDCNRDAFEKWEGSEKIEFSDMEAFFVYWEEHKDFLEAIAKSNRFWLLMERCSVVLNHQKNHKHFSGDFQNFAQEQAVFVITHGMMAILLRWYQFGFPATPQDMAKVTYDLFSSASIVRSDFFL